ncbi:MAG: fumarylacetoacetate hydrolase family protein [Bacteroidetes bacterium]|nr:fumarylacetoacetate hydrolase family protein [Bacteroidota bacterium]
MKIICIGRNYAEHAKEMNAPVPSEPVVFLKPDTALLKSDADFYYPEFTKDLHHEIELVIKICKQGRHIAPEFAHRYYEEIGIGIDFTARDIQAKCKEKGLPWEKAKAFDHSAPLGSFVHKSALEPLNNIAFRLDKNGATVQEGNTKDLLFSFDTLIAHASEYFTLKVGDLIFTGTPEGVGPVQIGDVLEGYIGRTKMLSLRIK